MSHKLKITSSPHVRSLDTTTKTMLKVIAALIPAAVAAVYYFGPRALILMCVSVVSCVLFELLYNIATKQEQTIGDLSAIITGLLLAFNVPSSLPIYMMVIGAFASIIVTKMLFGGLGHNFANPALVGRIVLLVSFGKAMTNWLKPGGYKLNLTSTTATPLGGGEAGYLDLFLGNIAGSLGETSALAILIGFILLVIFKVIDPIVPFVYIGTTALFTLALGLDPLFHILSGGLMLGAVFMATDYSTSPYTPWGKVVFGIGCGLITTIIRVYGGYPEGVSFAILFMNLLTPWIERWTIPVQFGFKQSKLKWATIYGFVGAVGLIILAIGINTIVNPTKNIRYSTNEQIVEAIGFDYNVYELSEEEKELGVAEVYVGSVNDAFVIKQKGFNQNSELIFLVVLDKKSSVVSVQVLQNDDTPQYGGQINAPEYLARFAGATKQAVGEVETIAGSTVSSSATKKSVEIAIDQSLQMKGEGE